MLLFFFAACAVMLFGCRLRRSDDGDALSKAQTSAVNGFFVLLVFLSHAVTYVTPAGALDNAYLFVKTYLGQLIVVPFLFFSGYGILRSFQAKGTAYLKTFPVRRFLRVLVHAETAVALFLLTNTLLQRHFGLRRTLLAFTFWEGIGNSNWYLFVILALYLCVMFAFLLFQGKLVAGTLLTAVLAAALVFVLHAAGKPSWWYNTILLFPAGMAYALLHDRVTAFLRRSVWHWAGASVLGVATFSAFSFLRGRGLLFYTLWAFAFMGCMVLVLLRFRFGNRVLSFFGRHVFSVFILQRIPMLVFSALGLAQYRYLFLLLSFAATLLLAVAFDWCVKKADGLLFSTGSADRKSPHEMQ